MKLNNITRTVGIGIIALAVLTLTGCGQPSFNSGSKGITFIGGKPYAIPNGARFSLETKQSYQKRITSSTTLRRIISTSKGDYVKLEKQRALSLIDTNKKQLCRPGQVLWISDSYRSERMAVLTKQDKTQTNYYLNQMNTYYQGRKNGLVGCANPLSKQEYQYRMNQENQANANARTQKNYDAATAPKYYNVNQNVRIVKPINDLSL